MNVLLRFSSRAERKSCDEAAVDITESSVALLREKGLDKIIDLAFENRHTCFVAGVPRYMCKNDYNLNQ